MRRIRAIIWLVILSISLPLLLVLFARWANASAPAMEFQPTFAAVVDTTASMGPELAALSTAWDAYTAESWRDYTRHDLVAFKNVAQHLGATADDGEFGDWLAQLDAGGGAPCPDGDLLGLRALAQNVETSRLPRTRALLVTDSSPRGDRRYLAYAVDRLLERGISVSTLRTGWCPGATLSTIAYQYLAIATGGMHFEPDGNDDLVDDTLIALDTMALPDLLESRAGMLDDNQSVILPFTVDGSITTLGATESEHHWWCLTCIAPIEPAEMFRFSGSPEMTFELVDPNGEVIMVGTPGYEVIAGSNMRLHMLRSTALDNAGDLIFPGVWEIRVTGAGSYMVDVMADSAVHLAYLGQHALPSSRPALFRAVVCEDDWKNPPAVTAFSLVNLHGDLSVQIELFDDGEHRDGQAGDGVWGGLVAPPPEPGIWRLAVEGQLSDGTEFRRIDPASIRYTPNRMVGPSARPALPGNMRQQTFLVVNDSADGDAPQAATFELALFSSQEWTPTDTVPFSITLAPGESYQVTVMTSIPADAPLDAVEEVTLVAAPPSGFSGGLSATSRTTVVDQLPLFLPVMIRSD